MSTLTVNTETQIGMIKDVVFAYVKVQQPALKFNSKTEHEYSIDAFVDKATAKAFKKAYPKNSVKEVENDEVENKYKISVPFPIQDEQFVIKLKAKAELTKDIQSKDENGNAVTLKAGTMIPYSWNSRPKVFVPTQDGVEDVTHKVLVANGSKGDIAFKINSNDYGVFPQFTGILVKELIEYQSSAGGSSSPFGNIVGGLATPPKPETTSPQVPAYVTEQVPDDVKSAGMPDEFDDFDSDSDCPF